MTFTRLSFSFSSPSPPAEEGSARASKVSFGSGSSSPLRVVEVSDLGIGATGYSKYPVERLRNVTIRIGVRDGWLTKVSDKFPTCQ